MPAKPFLAPAVEKMRPLLSKAIEDALKESMTEASARMFGPVSKTYTVPYAPEPWPFGTIAANTKGSHTVMVVRDEGDTFVAMQLQGSFVVGGPGRVAPGWPKRQHVIVDTP